MITNTADIEPDVSTNLSGAGVAFNGVLAKPYVQLKTLPPGNGSVINRCSEVLPRTTVVRRGTAPNTMETAIEFLYHVLAADGMPKFDSGASRCMSGDHARLRDPLPIPHRVTITGFNSQSSSEPTMMGVNADGKQEYYVSDMPRHLTLLCANAYCQDGCAVLFANDGLVLRMSADELSELKNFLSSYPVTKHLRVRNRTYEVDEANISDAVFGVDTSTSCVSSAIEVVEYPVTTEAALNSTATRFFNTKVNVSNQTERVLTLLMTGLTFRDWEMHVKNRSLEGIPPDLTLHGLHRFENRYGRTPEIVQLAHPTHVRHATGLRSDREQPSRTGARVEIDCMYSDYNIRETVPGTSVKPETVRSIKLPTHGGAIAAAVCVDCYSSFVHGHLLKSVAHPEVFVDRFLHRFHLDQAPVSTLAADSGVVTNSMFHVLTTKTEAVCQRWDVRTIERAEPYDHARITGSVEREIGLIKHLIRLAVTLILRNPNFPILGFSSLMVYKLWGEFLLWAMTVINLKPCPKLPKKSRWEVYKGEVPNMQDIRMLPIGCVLVVVREPGDVQGAGGLEVVKGKVTDNEPHGQVGLYVGPSLVTPGCVRAAVVTNGKLYIVTTSNFRSASDGGGLNIFPEVNRGVARLIQESVDAKKYPESTSYSEPEADHQEECDLLGRMDSSTDSISAISAGTESVPGRPLVDTNPTQDLEVRKKVRGDGRQHAQRTRAPRRPTRRKRHKNHDVPEVKTGPIAIPDSSLCDVNSVTAETAPRNVPTPVMEVVRDGPVESAPVPLAVAVEQGGRSTQSAKPAERRSARQQERRDRVKEIGGVATDAVDLEICCIADWSTHQDEGIYWSWGEFCFVQVAEGDSSVLEQGHRAVTDQVPKSFAAALADPVWGDAARKEINLILSSKAMVEVDGTIAKEAIKSQQADLMYLFPVYEEKLKEGVLVKKVRLVADGRTHHHAGDTFSATPSREELLILMHLVAALDWDYAHIDEIRAFLKAPYKGQTKAFVKFRGGNQYFEILGALYGLKTAPRDYQEEVARRLGLIGFTRLVMCSCIYLLQRPNGIVIVYDYVDDFIFTGSDREIMCEVIEEFRVLCETTEPIWDAERVLGMEFIRDRGKRVVKITMTGKICEVCQKTGIDLTRTKYIPMPQSGYIIKDYEFDSLLNKEDARQLSAQETMVYMGIVGGLIWITGLRLDVLFATMYLAWNTKAPRAHHMRMAHYVLSYLYTTRTLPLVLGGSPVVQVATYTDASLGTAPKGRSVVANLTKLNENAGAVSAHSKATQIVFTSSFEAELDGVARGLKAQARVLNILEELRVGMASVPKLWSDNKAMVDFVHGEGIARGVRHMELRMWYVREKYKQGDVVLDWMTGSDIPADKLTKLGTRPEHEAFTKDIMGLRLLEGQG